MSFAVIHMQKIKGNGVTGMQIHNQREKESDTNTDIEKERSHLNYDLENQNEIDYHEKIKSMIDERVDQTMRKVRKDAVKVASFMVTSDKDFFDRIGPNEEKRFFETARDFIGERYGKENIAYAMVHKDEKTPHMHLGFVPITEDGRLSAKDFFGKKQQLHQLQDDFHSHMKENGFDLERGVSSDKKHLDTAKFKLQTVQEKITGLENEFIEKQEEMKEIQEKLVDLDKSWDHTKLVDQIEFKESKIGSKTVKLTRLDFDNMKSLAKASESIKIENKELKRENNKVHVRSSELEKKNYNLEKKVTGLEKKNGELRKVTIILDRENKYLNRVISEMKVQFKDKIHEFGQKIGYLKATVLRKMDVPFLQRHFTDDSERNGVNAFLKIEHQEKEKEKNKPKQKGRVEDELER